MSRLAKQPLHGQPRRVAGLSDGTSGKQLRSCFTVSAQIKAANNLGNGFIAENAMQTTIQRPYPRQTTASDGGMGGKRKAMLQPLNGQMFGKS